MVVAMVGTHSYSIACDHAKSQRGSCIRAKQGSQLVHMWGKGRTEIETAIS
jgi:hypothetical protein